MENTTSFPHNYYNFENNGWKRDFLYKCPGQLVPVPPQDSNRSYSQNFRSSKLEWQGRLSQGSKQEAAETPRPCPKLWTVQVLGYSLSRSSEAVAENSGAGQGIAPCNFSPAMAGPGAWTCAEEAAPGGERGVPTPGTARTGSGLPSSREASHQAQSQCQRKRNKEKQTEPTEAAGSLVRNTSNMATPTAGWEGKELPHTLPQTLSGNPNLAPTHCNTPGAATIPDKKQNNEPQKLYEIKTIL